MVSSMQRSSISAQHLEVLRIKELIRRAIKATENAPVDSSPAAPLVGIEPNPGPTDNVDIVNRSASHADSRDNVQESKEDAEWRASDPQLETSPDLVARLAKMSYSFSDLEQVLRLVDAIFG